MNETATPPTEEKVTIYTADEMVTAAKSAVIAEKGKAVSGILNTIMQDMVAESKKGQYALDVTFDGIPESLFLTVVVILRELGYNVVVENNIAKITWQKL